MFFEESLGRIKQQLRDMAEPDEEAIKKLLFEIDKHKNNLDNDLGREQQMLNNLVARARSFEDYLVKADNALASYLQDKDQGLNWFRVREETINELSNAEVMGKQVMAAVKDLILISKDEKSQSR